MTVTAVSSVLSENSMRRGSAAAEEVDDDVLGGRSCGELKYALNELHGFDRVQDILGVLERNVFEQCLLRVLRVPHFFVEPKGLRGSATRHLRKKPLNRRRV